MKTNKKKYYWTKNRCKKVALKYFSRGEFSINDRTCYSISSRHKWLDEICSHMEFIKKPSGYWTLEKCKEAALKCVSQKDFYKNFRMAYEAAKTNDWLDDIRRHFQLTGNRYKRLIYAILFPNNSVYIGLTYNVEKRYLQHISRDYCTVYKYIIKTGLNPKHVTLTGLLEVAEAKIAEGIFVKKYKDDGFFILNRVKTGALGNSILKWTFDNCKIEALKYQTRNEFCIKSSSAYQSSRINGWADEICSHMISKHKPKGYWTFDICKELAKTCKNKEEFYKISGGGAFVASKKNEWINIFFPSKIKIVNK